MYIFVGQQFIFIQATGDKVMMVSIGDTECRIVGEVTRQYEKEGKVVYTCKCYINAATVLSCAMSNVKHFIVHCQTYHKERHHMILNIMNSLHANHFGCLSQIQIMICGPCCHGNRFNEHFIDPAWSVRKDFLFILICLKTILAKI